VQVEIFKLYIFFFSFSCVGKNFFTFVSNILDSLVLSYKKRKMLKAKQKSNLYPTSFLLGKFHSYMAFKKKNPNLLFPQVPCSPLALTLSPLASSSATSEAIPPSLLVSLSLQRKVPSTVSIPQTTSTATSEPA
jgi:hypothetical protein